MRRIDPVTGTLVFVLRESVVVSLHISCSWLSRPLRVLLV